MDKYNLYVCGDLHGNIKSIINFKNRLDNSKKNVLFCAGDSGFIFSDQNDTFNFGMQKKERKKLTELNLTIIVVLGNHENYDYIRNLPITSIFGGLCYYEPDISNVYYSLPGEVFSINKKNIWTFNGGMSTDKSYRLRLKAKTGYKYWWKEEIPSVIEREKGLYNLSKQKIDYIITHDAPSSVFKQIALKIKLVGKECALQTYFETVVNKCKFKHWFLGHYHPNQFMTIEEKYTVLGIEYFKQIN